MYAENQPVIKSNEAFLKGFPDKPYKIEANVKIQIIVNTQQH